MMTHPVNHIFKKGYGGTVPSLGKGTTECFCASLKNGMALVQRVEVKHLIFSLAMLWCDVRSTANCLSCFNFSNLHHKLFRMVLWLDILVI